MEIEDILSGDRAAISRAMSKVENLDSSLGNFLPKIYMHTGRATTITFTGPPGSGKSTLMDAMIVRMRMEGGRVGVIAIDPSSPVTGGAFLGDRVRMTRHALDEGVFIRSMATRVERGGLAKAVRNAMRILDSSGSHYVLIETAGVGQAEVGVGRLSDMTVLVLMPNVGDEIQASKAGLSELADIFVVNKADLPNATHMVTMLKSITKERNGWKPVVLRTIAKSEKGVDELLREVKRFEEFARKSGLMEKSRRMRLEEELSEYVVEVLKERLQGRLREEVKKEVDRVLAKEIDPYSAARKICDGLILS